MLLIALIIVSVLLLLALSAWTPVTAVVLLLVCIVGFGLAWWPGFNLGPDVRVVVSGLGSFLWLLWTMLCDLALLACNGVRALLYLSPIGHINKPIVDANRRKEGPLPEVFNVAENEYTYDDARAVCSAYGARLASYSEIERAYERGAEFCNYGWSEDQMALFPTQQTTYDQLQKKKGHEHDCGRPGVNGGYIANSGVKFGANCYGIKPGKGNFVPRPAVPETVEDQETKAKINYWKSRINDIMVSPFNNKQWSMF
jgi:hypothetical protein